MRGVAGRRQLAKVAAMSRVLRLLLAVFLLAAASAQAHEIDATQVRLTLHRDHTWTAVILAFPQTLANLLTAEAGEPQTGRLREDELRQLFERHSQALTRHIEVRFDGELSPAATVSVGDIWLAPDLEHNFVELRATGKMPDEAKTVSWRYGLVFATYALQLAVGDGQAETHWLQGDIRSRPFPIVHVPATRLDIGCNTFRLVSATSCRRGSTTSCSCSASSCSPCGQSRSSCKSPPSPSRIR